MRLPFGSSGCLGSFPIPTWLNGSPKDTTSVLFIFRITSPLSHHCQSVGGPPISYLDPTSLHTALMPSTLSCWAGRNFSILPDALTGPRINEHEAIKQEKVKQKLHNMYMWEIQGNWVTHRNGPSSHLKYHLQPKTKEAVGGSGLGLQKGGTWFTWRWKSWCLVNKCLLGLQWQWDPEWTLISGVPPTTLGLYSLLMSLVIT